MLNTRGGIKVLNLRSIISSNSSITKLSLQIYKLYIYTSIYLCIYLYRESYNLFHYMYLTFHRVLKLLRYIHLPCNTLNRK